MDGIKEKMAKGILATIVITPGLLFVGEMALANKENVAVVKTQVKSLEKQLDRMESKIDFIQRYLQGE